MNSTSTNSQEITPLNINTEYEKIFIQEVDEVSTEESTFEERIDRIQDTTRRCLPNYFPIPVIGGTFTTAAGIVVWLTSETATTALIGQVVFGLGLGSAIGFFCCGVCDVELFYCIKQCAKK